MLTLLSRFRRGRRSIKTNSAARSSKVRKAPPPRRLELEDLEQRMVLSPISDKYWALGGPSGFEGAAVTAERVAPDGVGHYQYFQGGAIYWSPGTGAHEVHGAILGEWGNLSWERGFLGYPTSDETTTGKGDGRYNWFQGGLIEWSPATGAHEVHGAILQEFGNLGYERSALGYPTTDETTTGSGNGRYNNFQNGAIIWSPGTGAHEVHGAIYSEWGKMGWDMGLLGYPTSDETATAQNGRYNSFQGGYILWSAATGAHEVHGAILQEYAGLGWQNSPLGFPTSDETDTARHDGRFNNFQFGNIYWSPATGAHEVHGAIWNEYTHLGWELSFLGFPTSDETSTAQNGRYNHFQGGYIMWSAATGAHEVHGAILDAYANLGWQNSGLGFPVSDETGMPGGGRFNHFQGGTIYWASGLGTYPVILQDRAVAAAEQAAAPDGVVNRNAMLAAFRQIETDGSVSAADFADLQALEAVPSFAMPDYVRILDNKLINGNPANAQYQGKPLGNLYAGSSAQQLTNLVNKWFVGADHPVASGTYKLASGSLFGSGMNPTLDVDQGAVGDCYFIAALGEVAYRTPDAINQMFIDNGDNTWTVRFFNNRVADYVTVDKYFPADGSGNFVYDNHDHKLSDGSNKLWVALAEKAYAQLAEEGWSRGTGANQVNSYAAIANGDPQNTLKEITGLATSGHNLTSSNSDRDAVSNAFNNGKLVCLCTPGSGVASNVVANHCYYLTYANPDSDLFILVNPWGLGASQPGILFLTWNEVAASFNYWSGTN